MRKIQVITLFPEMFAGVFGSSMMWKAQKDGHVELSTIDLRQFGLGPRRTVDDTPYGGGARPTLASGVGAAIQRKRERLYCNLRALRGL